MIELEGTNEERGFQHGSVLKDRVNATWTWYNAFFTGLSEDTLTEDRLREFGDHFAKEIYNFDPQYCNEIEAIAKGSGLEAWKIYCINSRTEIMYTLKREVARKRRVAMTPATEMEQEELPSECTSVYNAKFAVLAQNWDWCSDLEKLIVRTKVTREDGHTYISLHEPGMLGKIGVSSAGVGCLLNAMDCGEYLEETGLPMLDGKMEAS